MNKILVHFEREYLAANPCKKCSQEIYQLILAGAGLQARRGTLTESCRRAAGRLPEITGSRARPISKYFQPQARRRPVRLQAITSTLFPRLFCSPNVQLFQIRYMHGSNALLGRHLVFHSTQQQWVRRVRIHVRLCIHCQRYSDGTHIFYRGTGMHL